MASLRSLNRDELARALERYRSRHHQGREEAYDFNIKIHRVDLPRELRYGRYGRENAVEVDEKTQRLYNDEFDDFTAGVGTHEWVKHSYQAGRSGGWLVVLVKPGHEVWNEQGDLSVSLTAARRRLGALRGIEAGKNDGIRRIQETLSSRDFWGIPKQDWSPRDR